MQLLEHQTSGQSIRRSTLTAKQENFATRYVEVQDAVQAYRDTYDVDPASSADGVRVNAGKLLRHPLVARRIREIQDAAAELAVVNIAGRLHHQLEIAHADANEVAQLRKFGCRHCHGRDHKYQWRDPTEFADACEAWTASKVIDRPMPTDAGGYGYDPKAKANPDCFECRGAGVIVPFIADTTELTGAARLLYAGFEQKPDGTIKVLMHDQQKAADMVHKMLGAYVQRTESRSVSVVAHVEPLRDLTPAEILDLMQQQRLIQ